MKIEEIKIKNYKVFRDVEVKELSNLAIFVGKNGSGKTTFFDVFSFLHDCLNDNVKSALAKRGGYQEVVSRDCLGSDIEFSLKLRPSDQEPLVTYELSIGLVAKAPIVKSEVVRVELGGQDVTVLQFACGSGRASSGKFGGLKDACDQKEQKLAKPNILAIKALGQFKEFAAYTVLSKLLEDCFVPDFKLDLAQGWQRSFNRQLTRTGDNLAVVTKFIKDKHPDCFINLMYMLQLIHPGFEQILVQTRPDGYISLAFKDRNFQDPFHSMSDGLVNFFLHQVLLHEPKRHALLCVAEPENHCYLEFFRDLAVSFRKYASTSQVFVSTHSPEFLNGFVLDQIYCLLKKDGYTVIKRAIDDEDVRSRAKDDFLSEIWSWGYLLPRI